MVTTAANASTYVWWDVEGLPVGMSATAGQGQALVINVGAVAGPYDFTLVMKMSNDAAAATQGLTGYRINLWNGADANLSVTNPSAATPLGDEATIGLLNPLVWSGTKSGTIPGTDSLLLNYGRGRQSGGTTLSSLNSPQDWIRIELHAVGSDHAIYESVGLNLFGTAPPTTNWVYFGPNPAVTGATGVTTWNGASGYLPVISIIPEPATLVLLGLGLVGLIRRR